MINIQTGSSTGPWERANCACLHEWELPYPHTNMEISILLKWYNPICLQPNLHIRLTHHVINQPALSMTDDQTHLCFLLVNVKLNCISNLARLLLCLTWHIKHGGPLEITNFSDEIFASQTNCYAITEMKGVWRERSHGSLPFLIMT